MIKLDEHYSIKTDAYNFVLVYKKEEQYEEDGEVKTRTSKDKWYFPNLANCLQRYMNEAVKPAQNVLDLRLLLAEVEQNILTAVETLKQKQ